MMLTMKFDYLVKRGGVYMYRRRVLPNLRPIIGKREWKETLDTDDLRIAQVRWRAVHQRVEAGCHHVHRGTHPADVP